MTAELSNRQPANKARWAQLTISELNVTSVASESNVECDKLSQSNDSFIVESVAATASKRRMLADWANFCARLLSD